jgi:hypothetical protein
MGRKKFKSVGDAAFKAFLRRYDCPAPFHVVRMRFVGWVASPALAASPLPIIEAFQEDLAAAFRIRAEEIRDGFLVGYHGDGDETQAPEQLREQLARLKSLVEELDDLGDRSGRARLGDDKPLFAEYVRLFGVITGVAELQLTNLVLSAMALRAAELTGGHWGGEAK